MKITPDNLAALLVDSISRAIDGPRVGGRFTEMQRQIALLEVKIAELERAPRMKYLGKFEDGRCYMSGDAVSRGGSLWIAQPSDTRGVPGTDFIGWKLAVKRGHVEEDAEVLR